MSIATAAFARGMPFGLHVVGHMRGDAALLRTARALEALFATSPETARPVPDADGLPPDSPALREIVTAAPARDTGAGLTPDAAGAV